MGEDIFGRADKGTWAPNYLVFNVVEEIARNKGLGHILGECVFQGLLRKDYSEAEPSPYFCKPPRMGKIPNTLDQEAPARPSL